MTARSNSVYVLPEEIEIATRQSSTGIAPSTEEGDEATTDRNGAKILDLAPGSSTTFKRSIACRLPSQDEMHKVLAFLDERRFRLPKLTETARYPLDHRG